MAAPALPPAATVKAKAKRAARLVPGRPDKQENYSAENTR